MKTKTKFLLLSIIIFTIGLLPSVVNATTTYMSGDYTYTVSNNKATIIEYDGSNTSVSIPNKLGKYPVTEIGYQAFKNCEEIETISIPTNVSKIDEYAFSGCNFTTVKFASDCKITEIVGFSGMDKLTNINIPNKVKKIEKRAFQNDTGLTTITIPKSVVEIEYNAFYGCTGISTMNIPTNVSKIDEYAFSGCNFTTVKFASDCKITEIAGFSGMDKLTSINIPNRVKKIEKRAFRNDTGLTTITIPESVAEIGYNAFSGCTGLTSIKIPRRVEKIDEYAFYDCTLKNITFANDCMITEFPYFSDMSTLTSINIPRSVTSIQKDTFRNNKNLSEIVIPSSVTSIGYNAFGGCSNITVTIPSSVTYIDEYTFYNASNVTVKCESGSYAQTYCKNKGMSYIITTIPKPATPTNISKCSITGYKSKNYTGKEITQNIVVKYGKTTLTKGKDYVVEYDNNTNIGTAKMTVIGFGNYIGKVEKSFKIIPAKPTLIASSKSTKKIDLSWEKVKGASGYKVYQYNSSSKSWKEIKTTTGKSYTASGLKAGTVYKFRIRAYKALNGNNIYSSYSSTVETATKPSATEIKSISSKSKKANLKWKKVSGASGYEIYMSTSKNGKYSKIKNITKGSTVKYTKSSLKKNKKYYFKVRAYKTVNGKKIYSSYCKVKSIKIK